MEFVATYWLVWLLGFFCSLAGIIFFQIRAMNKMEMSYILFGFFGFLALTANVSMVLLIIAVIIHIVKMAMAGSGA